MSFRYQSELTYWDTMRPADAQALVDRSRVSDSISDPMIPAVPWSDTSMEEAELRGREGWEQHACERVQNGPLITLSGQSAVAAGE